MKALFFGRSDHQLFGVYHPPLAPRGKLPLCSDAILLCYPGVQEYNGNHWAFRRIASQLARLGCAVFRFDYFGTGDSIGDLSKATPAIWTENIRQAAKELSDTVGHNRLSILGMRLGASLAVLACTESLRARSLVLWEPVVSGQKYLTELRQRDAHKRLMFLHSGSHSSRSAVFAGELFGYTWPTELDTEINSIDLLGAAKPDVDRVSIVTSWPQDSHARLCKHLTAQGVTATTSVKPLGGDLTFDVIALREANVLSNELLDAITLSFSPETLVPQGTREAAVGGNDSNSAQYSTTT